MSKKSGKVPCYGISQKNTLDKVSVKIGGTKNDSVSPVSLEAKKVKI